MNRTMIAAAAIGLLASLSRAGDKPNIVLIVSDDQGHGDVSCFGGDIPTPSIDRIASEGVKWTIQRT